MGSLVCVSFLEPPGLIHVIIRRARVRIWGLNYTLLYILYVNIFIIQ